MATTKQKKDTIIRILKDKFNTEASINASLTSLQDTLAGFDKKVKSTDPAIVVPKEPIILNTTVSPTVDTPSPEVVVDEIIKEDPDIVAMKALLSQYTTLQERPIITNEIRQVIARVFINILRHCLNKGSNHAMLDEVVSFFITHRNGILAPSVALNGIGSLSSDSSMQLSTFYTVFCAIVELKIDGKVKVPIDIKAIRAVITNDDLISYIAKQFDN